MTKQLLIAFLISLILTLGACSTSTKPMPGDVISEDYEGGDVSLEDGAQTAGLEGEGGLSMGTLDDVIAQSAQLRLEGHADERGTREFNLALGEQRAQTVRDLIMLQGVSGNQLDIVSYGEEKPAVVGSGEQSWQKNRRVEIVQ